MPDKVIKTDGSEGNNRLATEILSHAENLLDSSLTRGQRDRIARIRIAAQGLLSNLKMTNGTTQNTQENGEHVDVAMEESVIPPMRILLAEDNPFTQKLMLRLLSQCKHEVEVVANGEAVLEKLQDSQFDIILLDIRMPKMDGIETAKTIRIREKTAGINKIPIIAVTVLAEEADKKNILAAGIDGYHGKPIRAKVLNQEMERVIHLATKTNSRKQIKANESVAMTQKSNTDSSQLPVEINMQGLLKTVENDWSLIREITDLFLSDAPRQMERIQEAIDSNNSDELLEASHSLKGAAGAFGNNLVSELAYNLEQLGRSKNIESAAEVNNSLKNALVAMEESLRNTLTRNGA